MDALALRTFTSWFSKSCRHRRHCCGCRLLFTHTMYFTSIFNRFKRVNLRERKMESEWNFDIVQYPMYMYNVYFEMFVAKSRMHLCSTYGAFICILAMPEHAYFKKTIIFLFFHRFFHNFISLKRSCILDMFYWLLHHLHACLNLAT